MKRSIFLFLVALLGTQNIYSQAGWFKLPQATKTEWRNPGGSFVGSLLIPGYGYFSNDMIKEGFVTVVIEGALIGAGMYAFNNPIVEGQYKYIINNNVFESQGKTTIRNSVYVYLGVAAGIHLFQAVHSTLLSHKFNKANGYAFKKLRKSSFEIQTAGVGMSMRLKF